MKRHEGERRDLRSLVQQRRGGFGILFNWRALLQLEPARLLVSREGSKGSRKREGGRPGDKVLTTTVLSITKPKLL